jgi:steroid delta-isomerase-like uncharacterized protein
MEEIDAQAAKDFLEEVYRTVRDRDLERLVTQFTEDCVFIDVTQPTPAQGSAAFREYMEETWRGLPDFRPESWTLIGEGDRIAAELVLTGTHEGEFFGFRPTGRKVRWNASAFYTLAPGGRQIAREAYYYDLQSLTSQLGAAEAAEGA